MSDWIKADLTALADAPDAVSDPRAYTTDFSSRLVARVLYRGPNSAIIEVRLEPGSGWTKADLTEQAGGSAASSAPFGYVTPFDGGTARIVYRGVDGHIHELRLEV